MYYIENPTLNSPLMTSDRDDCVMWVCWFLIFFQWFYLVLNGFRMILSGLMMVFGWFECFLDGFRWSDDELQGVCVCVCVCGPLHSGFGGF